jgi:uncharacterized protein YidB (DUF937 family)
MSVFSTLRKQVLDSILGQSGAADATEAPADVHPGLFDGIVAMIRDRGVSSLLDQLKKGGLAEAVSSWVGTGANLPVNADQIRAALGPETIENLAKRAGLPPGQASAMLAKILPGLVDHLTPGGTVDETRLAPDPATE